MAFVFDEAWVESLNASNWLASNPTNKTFAHCYICESDFFIGSSGLESVQQHSRTNPHQVVEKLLVKTQRLNDENTRVNLENRELTERLKETLTEMSERSHDVRQVAVKSDSDAKVNTQLELVELYSNEIKDLRQEKENMMQALLDSNRQKEELLSYKEMIIQIRAEMDICYQEKAALMQELTDQNAQKMRLLADQIDILDKNKSMSDTFTNTIDSLTIQNEQYREMVQQLSTQNGQLKGQVMKYNQGYSTGRLFHELSAETETFMKELKERQSSLVETNKRLTKENERLLAALNGDASMPLAMVSEEEVENLKKEIENLKKKVEEKDQIHDDHVRSIFISLSQNFGKTLPRRWQTSEPTMMEWIKREIAHLIKQSEDPSFVTEAGETN